MKNSDGFTLVELVIGMAMMTILMAAAFGVLSTGLKSYYYNQSQSHIIAQAGPTMSIITERIRFIKSISGLSLGSSANTLSFTDANDNNCTISVGSGTDVHTLIYTKGGSTEKFVPGIVKSITFTRDSSQTQLLTITLVVHDYSSTILSQDRTFTYTVFMPNVKS